MIRLTFHRRNRVSNRLALLGVLLLALTAFSGFDPGTTPSDMLPELAGGSAPRQAASDAPGPGERSRRSSISELLFGFGR